MNLHRALTVKRGRRFGSNLGSIETDIFVRLYLLFHSWASISKLEEGKPSIYSDNNSISYNQNDSGPSPSPSNSLSSVGAAASPTKFASLSPLTNNSDLAIPQVGRVSTPAKALLDHAETMLFVFLDLKGTRQERDYGVSASPLEAFGYSRGLVFYPNGRQNSDNVIRQIYSSMSGI